MNKKTLAERVGIHPNHLGDIENNNVNPPKAKTIRKISKELHLSRGETTDLLKEAENCKLSRESG